MIKQWNRNDKHNIINQWNEKFTVWRINNSEKDIAKLTKESKRRIRIINQKT